MMHFALSTISLIVLECGKRRTGKQRDKSDILFLKKNVSIKCTRGCIIIKNNVLKSTERCNKNFRNKRNEMYKFMINA